MSAEKIRTFDDFSRSASSRWATHEIIGRKPISEFAGAALDGISFKMRFDVRYGMNPKVEMDQLLIMCRDGRAETLIIGGTAYGMYKWVVKTVTQGLKQFDGSGNVLVSEVDVSLEEYMRR
ncbi:phage tail protein [Brevibacillus reuszeri]|uniref:phage tail protein n=1 Tax=Brevibacillus reuszeri TaxID=54915 RepID=UPI0028A12043|nr:phage tail protein [Brevibacillus reuszeri]